MKRRLQVVLGSLVVLVFTAGAAGAAPATVDFFPIPTPASRPADIVVGPDGNLWFTQFATDRVGRVTPAGIVTEFTLPPGSTGPLGLTFAGGFGFVCASTSDQIVRFDPDAASDAAIQSSFFVLGSATAGSRPMDIVLDPNSFLLVFTMPGRNQLARLGTAGGVILETPVPGAGSGPAGITVGPDGAVWFTQAGSDQIGRFTDADGITHEFPVPGVGSDPRNIVSGPDGALWFTQFGSDQIGRITTAGVVTEFPLAPGARPLAIANGPAPRLAFTQGNPGRIGLIDVEGAVSEIALPPGALPEAITIGPDGHIWFTERSSNQIGRATLLPPPTEPSLALQLNAASFGPGDTMTVVATLTPGPAPVLVDAYIVLRLPDGSLFSLQSSGDIVPGIVPIATGFVPVAFTGQILQLTFGGAEPAGDYAWFAALTEHGTLTLVGGVDEDPFAVGP